jgi:lauroyl/myristoyl acyltransferase
MKLSRYLQSKEILNTITQNKYIDARSYILHKGEEWFLDNPQEIEIIKSNLEQLNLSYSEDLIIKIKKNIILHYFEKLIAFFWSPKTFHTWLREVIDGKEEVDVLENSLNKGKGTLVAISHFGGVELISPWLSTYKFPLNVVLRFTTKEFSEASFKRACKLTESGYFGPLNFIEIGKPDTISALDMAASLRRKEVLVSVFDEKTEFSRSVKLFNTNIWGGAGLDKLIFLSRVNISLFVAFLIRTNGNRYRFKLIEIDGTDNNPVQSMYEILERIISTHLDQWYFLHEEIPFNKNVRDI